MPFSKFIVIPIFVAFQAATMMLLAPLIKIGPESIGGPALLSWISFQAWAMYFMGGCTVKMAGKTIVGYVGGIIASIAIFELAAVIGPLGGFGLALTVFIVVIPIIAAERIEIMNFIPAWFIGAAVFFALQFMSGASTIPQYIEIAVPEMIACVVGLFYGYCTVTFRTWYEKKVMPATDEQAEELKKSA
ncbi:MAG: DUF1097 domain-containing protein [Anaerohalosphaera sp.]|nr:DUF1097 domain-containing protein [Anaerohalosphaera sp.]